MRDIAGKETPAHVGREVARDFARVEIVDLPFATGAQVPQARGVVAEVGAGGEATGVGGAFKDVVAVGAPPDFGEKCFAAAPEEGVGQKDVASGARGEVAELRVSSAEKGVEERIHGTSDRRGGAGRGPVYGIRWGRANHGAEGLDSPPRPGVPSAQPRRGRMAEPG